MKNIEEFKAALEGYPMRLDLKKDMLEQATKAFEQGATDVKIIQIGTGIYALGVNGLESKIDVRIVAKDGVIELPLTKDHGGHWTDL